MCYLFKRIRFRAGTPGWYNPRLGTFRRRAMYHFVESFQNSDTEELRLFRQNAADGEILLIPYREGYRPKADEILISDNPAVIPDWTAAGGLVIGYEHDGVRLNTVEIITDLSELYPEDLAEIADYLTETRHMLFFSGEFDYYKPGYTDYSAFHEIQAAEPYLMPDALRNLSETQLHEQYRNTIRLGRLNSIFTECCFCMKDSDTLIGRVAVEQSELTENAYNISYFILPEYRNRGLGTNAVKAFLTHMRGRLDKPLLAIINRRNLPSVALAKACGFTVLPKTNGILPTRPEDYFIMIYEDSEM